jgi:hypothetical protein
VKINAGAFKSTALVSGRRQSDVGRELGEFGLDEYLEIKEPTL